MNSTHKQPDHLTVYFYYRSTQQQRQALHINSQQRSIIVTDFDLALYNVTENSFLLFLSRKRFISLARLCMYLLYLFTCVLSSPNKCYL